MRSSLLHFKKNHPLILHPNYFFVAWCWSSRATSNSCFPSDCSQSRLESVCNQRQYLEFCQHILKCIFIGDNDRNQCGQTSRLAVKDQVPPSCNHQASKSGRYSTLVNVHCRLHSSVRRLLHFYHLEHHNVVFMANNLHLLLYPNLSHPQKSYPSSDYSTVSTQRNFSLAVVAIQKNSVHYFVAFRYNDNLLPSPRFGLDCSRRRFSKCFIDDYELLCNNVALSEFNA